MAFRFSVDMSARRISLSLVDRLLSVLLTEGVCAPPAPVGRAHDIGTRSSIKEALPCNPVSCKGTRGLVDWWPDERQQPVLRQPPRDRGGVLLAAHEAGQLTRKAVPARSHARLRRII